MMMNGSKTENIKVYVRVRPELDSEIQIHTNRRQTMLSINTRQPKVVEILDDNIILLNSRKNDRQKHYIFNEVFNENATQAQLFESTTNPLIDHVLDGYNATIFAYGATGCGKTHTITGTEEDPGIIYRTIHALYQKIALITAQAQVEIAVSFLEVYNETIIDLISKKTDLEIREFESRIVVAGLTEIIPRNLDHILKLLSKGNENRTKAFTHANASSSRSHAILLIHIRQKSLKLDSNIKVATLSIIDLAGSERASATLNKGERLHEGANINRSLLALGNCINALCSETAVHVPYRNSKLTRLLKHSLSGSCKVVMIANISPTNNHSEETSNTLKYASRAKEIKTISSQNHVDVVDRIAEYPKIIQSLKSELLRLQKLIPSDTVETNLDPRRSHTSFIVNLMTKIQEINFKIRMKTRIINECEYHIRLNDLRVKNVNTILQTINHGTELSQQKYLNESVLKLNEFSDKLEESNIVFGQSADMHRASLSKYTQQKRELSESVITGGLGCEIENMIAQSYKEEDVSMVDRSMSFQIESEKININQSVCLLSFNLQYLQNEINASIKGKVNTAIIRFISTFVNLYLQENNSVEFDEDQAMTLFSDDEDLDKDVSSHGKSPDDLHNEVRIQTALINKINLVVTPDKSKCCDINSKSNPKSKRKVDYEIEDQENTPTQAKKCRLTPKVSVRKLGKAASRSKARMSMIPLFSQSSNSDHLHKQGSDPSRLRK